MPVHRAVADTARGMAYDRRGLDAIVMAELGQVAGLRLLHLQCHFGRDTLALAAMGAAVTGVDFSGPAIEAARADAAAQGCPARFVLTDVYGAPAALGGETFDVVFTTWGTIGWLPDIGRWARVVAACLRPGGRLYVADIHPVALVFDDLARMPDGRPGMLVPYFEAGPHVFDDPTDYADPEARLVNSRTVSFMHPTSAIMGALVEAGLRVTWLREHARVPWKAFACLEADGEGFWGWADRPWLPLALSLEAVKG